MNNDFKFYFDLFLKRLPIMAAIFIVCAGIGLLASVTMPPKYEADARLLMESAQIATSGAGGDTAASERLEIIRQRLMTRQNMVDIANKYRVFDGEGSMSPDQVVNSMRSATQIQISGRRDNAMFMTISFDANDPRVAASVVNEMVTLILSEDREIVIDGTRGSLDFFEQEVERLSEDLSEKSEQILRFKDANKDALPDNLNYKIETENRIIERIQQAERDIESLADQREQLELVGVAGLGTATGPVASPEQQALKAAQAELRTALTVYSEANPRVKMLRAQVSQLEAQVAAQVSGSEEIVVGADPAETLFKLRMNEIETRTANLNQQIERGREELSRLRAAIERTPQVEIRLAALEREYDMIQQELARKSASLNAAETDERIAETSRGEKLTVVEQAIAPSQPTSPNRILIAGGGVFAGTGLAALFFLLTEVLNRSVRRPVDLVRAFGVQPLATIPYLEDERVTKRRRSAFTGLVAVLIVAIPLALWAVNQFYLPLDLIVERVLETLGL